MATLNPLGDDLFDEENNSDEDSENEEEVARKDKGKKRGQEGEAKTEKKLQPHQMLRRQDARYKEIKRMLARRAKARREDKGAMDE